MVNPDDDGSQSCSFRAHDAAVDLKIRQDGYAVVDLLERDAVEYLLERWDEVRTSHPLVWDPTGLAATIRHPPVNEVADAFISPVIASALAPLLPDHVPLMSSFLVKRPHAPELPPHLDWRLVDEVTALSGGCWVPLEDVDRSNGALGVYPGSHHSVTFDRTPEEPGHDWVADYAADRHQGVVLELTAGQAVLYDHRLVHFSPPNPTDRVRIATNSGLAPAELAQAARRRLMAMMARGMSGEAGEPQIPAVGS